MLAFLLNFKIVTIGTRKEMKLCHRAKFVAIGQTVDEICAFSVFQNGGWPPFWIFEISKI